MNKRIFATALTGVVLISGANPLHAGSKAQASSTPSGAMTSASPFPTAPATRPIPFSGKIYTVDKVSKTFTTQNKEKKIRTFIISSQSKITKDNRPAKFEELRAGDEIHGMALKEGDGRFDILSLRAGGKEESVKSAASAIPAATVAPSPRKRKPAAD